MSDRAGATLEDSISAQLTKVSHFNKGDGNVFTFSVQILKPLSALSLRLIWKQNVLTVPHPYINGLNPMWHDFTSISARSYIRLTKLESLLGGKLVIKEGTKNISDLQKELFPR